MVPVPAWIEHQQRRWFPSTVLAGPARLLLIHLSAFVEHVRPRSAVDGHATAPARGPEDRYIRGQGIRDRRRRRGVCVCRPLG